MSCVHYKFSSKLNYDTVTFDGLHISLCDLKKQIMGREKLKAADCDLQITNAQTKEGKRHADPCAVLPRGGCQGRRAGRRANRHHGPWGTVRSKAFGTASVDGLRPWSVAGVIRFLCTWILCTRRVPKRGSLIMPLRGSLR